MLIRHQMMFIVVLTVLFVGLIILVTYYQTSNILRENNKEYSSDMVLQVSENVSSNCAQIDKIATSIAYDIAVQNYLLAEDYSEKLKLVELLDNLFKNVSYLREGILDIVVLGENGNSYSMSGSTDFIRNYASFIKKHEKPSYTGIEVLNSGVYQDKMCFVVGMPVYSTNPDHFSQNSIGVIALILNYNIFDSSIEKISMTPIRFYLLDRNLNIIANNDSKTHGTRFDLLDYDEIAGNKQTMISIDGKKSIVQIMPLGSIDGSIVTITTEASLFQELYSLRKKILMISIIALVLITIPFTIMVINILHPIKK